jgi:tectonin beta-propeller repeat-containing protein 1
LLIKKDQLIKIILFIALYVVYSTSSIRVLCFRWHWSDECGLAHRPKDSFQLPSGSWRWDTEWLVDYNQTDEEGWRYAIDFPTSYHTEKSFRDCVRRRRWSRVMKLESAAPWLPGPAIKLKSISICASVKSGDIVPVWGITVDGSVVLRDRVTTSSPQGDTWIAVKNPIPFVEISVGPFCVWATASDGTAYVRNGTKTKMDGLYWFQVHFLISQSLSVLFSSVFSKFF